MSDYAFYYACLRGEKPEQPAEPQPGRYRIPARRTDGEGYRPAKSTPVAIWPGTDGQPQVMIGAAPATPISPADGDRYLRWVSETWSRCAAIAPELYDHVMNGGSWPDEHEAVTRSNRAPADDSFEAIRDRIEDLKREAEALIKAGAATTREQADRASDLANEIGKYEKKADAARKAEKQPHLEAGAAVDRKWQPVILAAAVCRALKATVITPFLAELNRRQTEAAFQATLSGAKEPHPAERPKATAGSRGRPVSLRTVKRVEITDRAALLAHFADHADVTALLQQLAERSVRAGVTPAGVRVTETKVAA